jgi:hypothetical protein
MGDRIQIFFPQNGVYLYSHWGGESELYAVQKALKKQWRWQDPTYLARIVFCEMVKGEAMEETGYGIGTKQHADVYRLIVIDTVNQMVKLQVDDCTVYSALFTTFIDLTEMPVFFPEEESEMEVP